jgi:hypothetical protein
MTGEIAEGVVVSIRVGSVAPLEFNSSKVALMYKLNRRGAEGKP